MGAPRHRGDRLLHEEEAVRADRRHGRLARDARRARARRSDEALTPPESAAAVLGAVGLAGAVWGVAADRIAARWPAHEDGSRRPIGWRTAVVAAGGGLALVGVAYRYGDGLGQGPGDGLGLGLGGLVVVGAYALSLVLLLATDLDQRLLPDAMTLPWIPLALLATLAGLTPAAAGGLPGALLVALGIPLVLFALSIPFGSGAIGIGDLKLLVSAGLLLGVERAPVGLLAGVLLAGGTIGLLLVLRRITLRSYVPYGPFLIAGTLWALLLPPAG